MKNLTDFKTWLFVVVLMISLNSFSQIVIGDETSQPTTANDAVTKKERKVITDDWSEFYFGIQPMYTFRTLKTNEGLFGKPLGDKEEEFGDWVSSYGLGVRTTLNHNFILDIGVGVSRNRESFSIDRPDSLFQYSNTYRHIAMPIRIGYNYGKDLAFFAAVGLMPKAFLSERRDIFYRDNQGFDVEEKELFKNNYQQFLVDAIASVGIRLSTDQNFGFFLMAEGAYQLTNNYTKQGPFIRNSFGVGLSVGFQFYL